MRANGWDSPSVFRRTGSSAFAFEPRTFPLVASTTKGRVPKLYCKSKSKSESDTTNIILKNVEWGWRGQNTLGNPRV